LSRIPEYEYENLCLWCVENLPKILEKGGFTNEGDIEARKNKYIMASNPLPIFIDTCCIVEQDNPNCFVSAAQLYQLYVKALTVARKRIIHRKEFIKSMTDSGFQYDKINKSLENGAYFNGYAFIGINIKSDINKQIENAFVTNVTNVTTYTTTPLRIEGVVNHVTFVTTVTNPIIDVLDYVHQYGKVGIPLTDVLNRCDKQTIEKLLKKGDLVEIPSGIIKSSKALSLNEETI
jgi:hypothetical protein